MRTLHVKVAGTSFEGRQELIAKLNGNEPVRLVPEPTNKYDANAIAVQVAKMGAVYHVGYIPKELAKDIAPVLDNESLMCQIDEILGGFETYDGQVANYGLRIKVELPDAAEVIP